MHCHMTLLIFHPEIENVKPDICEGSAGIHDFLRSLIRYHQFHQGTDGIQDPIPKITEGSNGIQDLLMGSKNLTISPVISPCPLSSDLVPCHLTVSPLSSDRVPCHLTVSPVI